MAALIDFPKERIAVSPPSFGMPAIEDTSAREPVPVFLYPSTPDCHKNMETVCQAARLLAWRTGQRAFRLVLTIKGDENRYARWLHEKFGREPYIDFHGFMSREALFDTYGKAACLVFMSRVETWGLPISEFGTTGKPMILPDLPYAHETAAGAGQVYFCRQNVLELCDAMDKICQKNLTSFKPVPAVPVAAPAAGNWEQLFQILMEGL